MRECGIRERQTETDRETDRDRQRQRESGRMKELGELERETIGERSTQRDKHAERFSLVSANSKGQRECGGCCCLGKWLWVLVVFVDGGWQSKENKAKPQSHHIHKREQGKKLWFGFVFFFLQATDQTKANPLLVLALFSFTPSFPNHSERQRATNLTNDEGLLA